MFLVIFIWFGRMNPLPTYPKEWDQNQVVHSQKLLLWVRLILKFLKMILRREKGPQGIEEKGCEVVWF